MDQLDYDGVQCNNKSYCRTLVLEPKRIRQAVRDEQGPPIIRGGSGDSSLAVTLSLRIPLFTTVMPPVTMEYHVTG